MVSALENLRYHYPFKFGWSGIVRVIENPT
jgi:hypothetical protein